MVEGTTFDFETARELGLVNEVWEARDARGVHGRRSSSTRTRFAPPERAPLAVGRIKRAVQTGIEMALEQGLALERELQAELFASDDAREGPRRLRREAESGVQGQIGRARMKGKTCIVTGAGFQQFAMSCFVFFFGGGGGGSCPLCFG